MSLFGVCVSHSLFRAEARCQDECCKACHVSGALGSSASGEEESAKDSDRAFAVVGQYVGQLFMLVLAHGWRFPPRPSWLLSCASVLRFALVCARPAGRAHCPGEAPWLAILAAGWALLAASSELVVPGWLLYLLWLGWRLGRLSWAGVPLQASPGPSGRAHRPGCGVAFPAGSPMRLLVCLSGEVSWTWGGGGSTRR